MNISTSVKSGTWFLISSGGLYLTAASCRANKIHPVIAGVSVIAGAIFSSAPLFKIFTIQAARRSFGGSGTSIGLSLSEQIYKSAFIGYVDPVLRQLSVVKVFAIFKKIALLKVASASLAWFELGFMVSQTLWSGFVCKKIFLPQRPPNGRPGSGESDSDQSARRNFGSSPMEPLSPAKGSSSSSPTNGGWGHGLISSFGSSSLQSSETDDMGTSSLSEASGSDHSPVNLQSIQPSELVVLASDLPTHDVLSSGSLQRKKPAVDVGPEMNEQALLKLLQQGESLTNISK